MSLDDLRNLQGFDYIHILAHGGYGGHFLIHMTSKEYMGHDEAMIQDIVKERAIAVHYVPLIGNYQNGEFTQLGLNPLEQFDGGNYIVVMPKFFKDYYGGGRLSDPIVFLQSCALLNTRELSNVLIDAGAECVIGFDKEVRMSYADVVSYAMIQGLIQGASVAESLEAIISHPDIGPDDSLFGGIGTHPTIHSSANPVNIYLIDSDSTAPEGLIARMSRTWRPVSVNLTFQPDATVPTVYTYSQISPTTDEGISYNREMTFNFESVQGGYRLNWSGGNLYMVNNAYAPPDTIRYWDPIAVFNIAYLSGDRLERVHSGIGEIIFSFEILPSGQLKYAQHVFAGGNGYLRDMEIVFDPVD